MLVRLYVAATDIEAFERFLIHEAGAKTHGWAGMPDGSRVYGVNSPNDGHRAHLISHPSATVLPHPHSPAKLKPEIVSLFPHVASAKPTTAYELFEALHAHKMTPQHVPHPLLDPEM